MARVRDPEVRHAWRRPAGLLIAAALVLALAAPESASAADSSASPFPLTIGKRYRGTNPASTIQPGEPLTAAGPGDCGGRKMGHTRWFKVTGTGSPVTIDTAGSNFDTILGYYATLQPPSPATFLGCHASSPGSTAKATLTFSTAAGADYLLQLGGSCAPACSSGTYRITAVNATRQRSARGRGDPKLLPAPCRSGAWPGRRRSPVRS